MKPLDSLALLLPRFDPALCRHAAVLEAVGLVTCLHDMAVMGQTVQERRGLLQRMWGAGTLVLSNGVDAPVRLRRIANVALVYEVLVDQVVGRLQPPGVRRA